MSEDGAAAKGTPQLERSRFSGLHSRTYEMELLLSGAVVLGMMQLPPLVQSFFGRLAAGLAGNLRLLGSVLEGYVTMMLYALIGTFLLHLTMRAFWIGLIGLESVYPGGIAWDRLKAGPRTLECYRREVTSLGRAIDRADDLCSLVFSFGYMVTSVFVYSLVVMVLSAAIAFVVSHTLLGGDHAEIVFGIVVGMVIGSQLLVPAIDKRYGPRLAPGSTAQRLLDRLVQFSFVTSHLRMTGAVQLALASNLSESRFGYLLLLTVTVLGIGKIGVSMVSSGTVRFDSYHYFPANLCEQGLDPRHYRDQRGPRSVEPEFPSLQSEVIEGPYAVLSLPYYPRLHNPLMAEACPQLQPLRAKGIVADDETEPRADQVRAAADCLGSLFKIRLDTAPLDQLHFDFAVEPGTGLKTIVAHLPVRELAAGRHELEVVAPDCEEGSRDGLLQPVRHLIPFWR